MREGPRQCPERGGIVPAHDDEQAAIGVPGGPRPAAAPTADLGWGGVQACGGEQTRHGSGGPRDDQRSRGKPRVGAVLGRRGLEEGAHDQTGRFAVIVAIPQHQGAR